VVVVVVVVVLSFPKFVVGHLGRHRYDGVEQMVEFVGIDAM